MPEFAAVYNRLDTYLSGEDDKGKYVVPMITQAISSESFALRDFAENGRIYI
jgi:hypothetical protein